MVQKENKFIVINVKHLVKMQKEHSQRRQQGESTVCKITADVLSSVAMFNMMYQIKLGTPIGSHEYIVCNKDETYAEDVYQIILKGEKKKEDERGSKGFSM